MGLVSLQKEATRELACSLSPGHTEKVAVYSQEESLPQGAKSAGTLTLDFWPPVYGICYGSLR